MRLPLSTGLAAALSFSTVQAYFTVGCDNPVVVERADPVVSPGEVAGHVHTIMGGSNVGPNSTYESLMASECTSCDATADLSAYWTPPLYFQWKNGSFSPVGQTSSTIFFVGRTNESDTTNITAFPEGFKMLSGSPNIREFNASSAQANAIGWRCFGGGGFTNNIPSTNCPGGLSTSVRFPSCWNGQDLYNSDQSHVAFPSGNKNGSCPPTHSTRLVELFYSIHWDVNAWNSSRSMALNSTQPFVLANGDPLGYGLHGDFQNGWKVDVLQSAIDTCLDPRTPNILDQCAVLERTNRTRVDFCRRTPDIDETVTGALDTLAGCNPVSYTVAEIPSGCNKTVPAFVSPGVYYGDEPASTLNTPTLPR